MSNFKIHKFHLVLGLFVLVLAASVFVGLESIRARAEELKKSRAVVAGEKVSSKEETFAQPRAVTLTAEVISTFVGGRDLAVKSDYQQFYVAGYADEANYSEWVGAKVKVEGMIVGITCAYAKTFFADCVPEIMASSIIKVE